MHEVACIGPRIDPSLQGPVPGRHMRENIGDVGRANVSHRQRCVEGGECKTTWLALDDLGQRIPSSDAVLRTVGRVEEWTPVQLDTIALGLRQPHETVVRRAQPRAFPLDVEKSRLVKEVMPRS